MSGEKQLKSEMSTSTPLSELLILDMNLVN